MARIKHKWGGRTLFCNNCTGAMVLHDYGLRFDTPTVNLYIPPNDYVEMLSDLNYYMKADFVDISDGNKYPIGLLGGKVRVNFLHYDTFEEAVTTWKRRASRVNYNNLWCVLVERDGTTYDDLRRFDSLPFAQKVALVHKEYPGIKCAYKLDVPVENGQLGQIISYCSFWGSRYYDQFDWVKFLQLL